MKIETTTLKAPERAGSGWRSARDPAPPPARAHAGPHFEGVPLLGIIGFSVAGALGAAWAVLALKSGKL